MRGDEINLAKQMVSNLDITELLMSITTSLEEELQGEPTGSPSPTFQLFLLGEDNQFVQGILAQMDAMPEDIDMRRAVFRKMGRALAHQGGPMLYAAYIVQKDLELHVFAQTQDGRRQMARILVDQMPSGAWVWRETSYSSLFSPDQTCLGAYNYDLTNLLVGARTKRFPVKKWGAIERIVWDNFRN